MERILYKRKLKESNYSVSEIIGMLLLLFIVVSLFSITFLTILSDNGPEPQTFVKITGEVIGREIIFEHQGGEVLNADTIISIDLPNNSVKGPVSNWLEDSNHDMIWNLGERMIFPFDYDLDHLGDYAFIDTKAIDPVSNSIVFMGPVKTRIVSDVGVEVFVDNMNPSIYDNITIRIVVTSYGGDVNGSGNVRIRYQIPEGLTFLEYTANQGIYDNQTGLWSVGNVHVTRQAIIDIVTEVTGVMQHEPVQLALVLEGGYNHDRDVGIHESDWHNQMMNSIKHAIQYSEVIPHDGSVELTVVKYGYDDPPRPDLILSPTILTDDNDDDLAKLFDSNEYPDDYFPLASTLRYTSDIMRNVGDFAPEKRQIILIVSCGYPDCVWVPGSYEGIVSTESDARISTIEAIEYVNDTLQLDPEHDELNAIAVGKWGVDIDFLNVSVPLPKPGYLTPPITDPGWVYTVDGGWKDFEGALHLILRTLLNEIFIKVELFDSSTIDLNPTNNNAVIIIDPNDN